MTEIQDTDIRSLHTPSGHGSAGFVWIDNAGKTHIVSLKAAKNDYQKMHAFSSGNCIGERNLLSHTFILYSGSGTIKILFRRRFVFDHLKRIPLTGSRDKRFHQFQAWIISAGYTTYDLS